MHTKSLVAFSSRPVVPGGAGGVMAPPIFGASVNPISTRKGGGQIMPPHHEFSDLPTALSDLAQVLVRRFLNND